MNESWEAYLPSWLVWVGGAVSDRAGVFVLLLLANRVSDTLGRTVGLGSIESVIELSSLSVLLIVCFGLAACTAVGGHIVIDLFTRNNSSSTNRIIDAFWLLVMAGIVGLIAWYSIREAMIAHDTGERSEVLQWSPLVAAAPAVVGLALTAVVALTIGIVVFRRLLSGQTDVPSERN
jgi:TRAP-type C4-dicarboxylate transport system permease small subunit